MNQLKNRSTVSTVSRTSVTRKRFTPQQVYLVLVPGIKQHDLVSIGFNLEGGACAKTVCLDGGGSSKTICMTLPSCSLTRPPKDDLVSSSCFLSLCIS
jgi:hypothetical protein